MFADGMNASINATETLPSANATGMPDKSRISATTTNRMPISLGLMSPRAVDAVHDAAHAMQAIVDHLHDVLDREQRHADRHHPVRDPELRRPHRIGGPAFTPRLPGVGPYLDGDEAAKQQRQDVAR